MRRSLLPFALLLALLALPAAAQAGTPFTIGNGQNPHVLVDGDGTGHVAWSDENANTVKYCKVARGSTACGSPATLNLPSGDVYPPWLVRGPGATLYIAMPRYVPGETRLWTSNDNGASWVSPTGVKIYDTPNTTDSTEPILGPTAGEITFASWNPGRQIWGADIGGTESASTDSASPANPAMLSGISYDLSIAPTGGGGLLATSNDLDNTYFWTMAPGNDPSQTGSWSGSPTQVANLDTSRLAGGSSGAFLWGVAGNFSGSDPRRVEIRKWTGSGFTSPNVLETNDAYIGDVTVGTAGAVGAIWRRNGSPNRLRFARSTDGGGSYSVNTIALEEGVMPGMDLSLADDGNGFAVWQGAGTGVSNENEIRVANTDTVAEPTTGGSGGGGGGTTPTPTTPPRPLPRPSTTPLAVGRRVTARVNGASIFLGLPRGCIPAGRPFIATLTWRRQRRKGNKFVKITRTDFYIGNRRVRIDRRAPFRQTLRIPSPRAGQAYRFRARAFIKVRRGRGPKKSIFSTLRVCR